MSERSRDAVFGGVGLGGPRFLRPLGPAISHDLDAATEAALERGMADVAARRTVGHEDAMARLRKTARGE